jgi:hypothetical protein
MGKQEHKLKRTGKLQKERNMAAAYSGEAAKREAGFDVMAMAHSAGREKYHRLSSKLD